MLDERLDALEERLCDAGFVRVHRAELVNLAHVRPLPTEDQVTNVELSDGQRTRASRPMVVGLEERLGIR